MKYIKLSKDHRSLESALYSQKPRQIRRLSDDIIHHHDWFLVDEVYPTEQKNKNLYELVRERWEVVQDRVVFHYTFKLRPIEHRRQYYIDRVNDIRASVLATPIVFDGRPFDRDQHSMVRITGATIMAITDPEYTVEWITADNTSVIMSAEDVVKMGKSQAIFESNVINFARVLKDRIKESNNPESIDIQADWPSRFFTSDMIP